MSTAHPQVAAVILAAGLGSRMGGPKGQLSWGETSLLGAWRALFEELGIGRILAVVGPGGAGEIVNPDPAGSGPRESLALGLAALPEADRVFFTPVDVPPVSIEVLRALLAAPPTPWRAPRFEGRTGHPALLDRSAVGALLAAEPGARIDEALEGFRVQAVEVEDPRVLANMNRPGDYERFRP